jgi:hypothetical protein
MSTATILFGALFLLMALAIFFIVRIELRLKRFFQGKKAGTLEALIGEIVEEQRTTSAKLGEQAEIIRMLEARLEKQGRGVKLVRFNPFGEVGSTQSFAVAIMNKEGDGVVFSSLYSRERMSVFAKPITKGKSDIELTPEEQSVIKDAQEDAAK